MSFRTLARLWYITSTPSLASMTKPRLSPSGTSTVLLNPRRSVQKGRQGSIASTTSTGESLLSLSDGTRPPPSRRHREWVHRTKVHRRAALVAEPGAVDHLTRIPSFASQCSGRAALGSGLSATCPTDTPYFQSGGQIAMNRA